MKKALLLILLVAPAVIFGQDNPYKYWKLERLTVSFDAVYEDSGASIPLGSII